jgi:maltose/moltooligosaccharide transporter
MATSPASVSTSISDNASPALKAYSFWRLFNLSLGFLGIQFGWAIQNSQMAPLLERLGSEPWITNVIACAGPITGILVQPIVGALSDQSTHPMGRRRPFIFVGALLTALSLILMPNSPGLLVAAALLWILDASLNTTQGPYRAMVPDSVPSHQRATAYSLMSFTIGLGSVIAFGTGFAVPELFENLKSGGFTFEPFLANDMQLSFYLAAVALLVAMTWTCYSNYEKPISKEDAPGNSTSFVQVFVDTFKSIKDMPGEAKKLCLTHSFTWFGWACLFYYFSLFVPHHIFNAPTPESPGYDEGVQWVSMCYLIMNLACLSSATVVTYFCNRGASRKVIHTLGLLCVGGALLSAMFVHTPQDVAILMAFVGIGWSTTLSIPFALLAEHMPPGREGLLMGSFNMFIAAPQVLTSVIVGPAVKAMDNNVTVALIMGGVSMVIASLLLQRVQEQKHA